MADHRILPKPPKRLAVVDQNDCSGCAGSPACQSYCETVSYKKTIVDAIRAVPSPEHPFGLCVVELDKCIGCGLCATVCPWDAITMYLLNEALQVAAGLTLVAYEAGREQNTEQVTKEGGALT